MYIKALVRVNSLSNETPRAYGASISVSSRYAPIIAVTLHYSTTASAGLLEQYGNDYIRALTTWANYFLISYLLRARRAGPSF